MEILESENKEIKPVKKYYTCLRHPCNGVVNGQPCKNKTMRDYCATCIIRVKNNPNNSKRLQPKLSNEEVIAKANNRKQCTNILKSGKQCENKCNEGICGRCRAIQNSTYKPKRQKCEIEGCNNMTNKKICCECNMRIEKENKIKNSMCGYIPTRGKNKGKPCEAIVRNKTTDIYCKDHKKLVHEMEGIEEEEGEEIEEIEEKTESIYYMSSDSPIYYNKIVEDIHEEIEIMPKIDYQVVELADIDDDKDEEIQIICNY